MFCGILDGTFQNVHSFKAEPSILYPVPPPTVSYLDPGEKFRVSSKFAATAASGERCAIALVDSCAPFQLLFISERRSCYDLTCVCCDLRVALGCLRYGPRWKDGGKRITYVIVMH